MSTQAQKAEAFRALHVPGQPVVIFNIWDAGSAKAVADAGAAAIATGSAPVAMANGRADGEQMPLDLALANVERIVGPVDLPVSMDIEGGYGTDPAAGAETFRRAIAAGAVGMNFEDQIVGGAGLHDIDTQVARIAAARAACDGTGVRAFINARTDIFLKANAAGEAHTADMLEQAVARANAYAGAGADGFFAPGMTDLTMIETLCGRTSLPVNMIALPGSPEPAALASAGVARISYGPVPYRRMIEWLGDEARAAMDAATGNSA